MKKAIAATLIFTALGLSGVAQEKKGGNGKSGNPPGKEVSVDQRVKNQTNKAEKELGLTAEQKTKWEAAVRERITANKSVREKLQGSTTPDERKQLHQQAKANMKKFDETVSAFLTPEQKAKYDAKKKEKKEKFEKERAGKKGGAPSAEDIEELKED